MSRIRNVRVLFASIVALASLIMVTTASAAAWQGPWQVSAAGVNAGDTLNPPQIAMGTAGDATAAWWEPDGVTVARKLAGQAWSAPLLISNPSTTTTVYPGVDGAGNTTTAWSRTGPDVVVSYWPVNASVATSQVLPVAFQINDLAVNAAGAAVIAGTSGNNIVVGYRQAGGTFTFDYKTIVAPTQYVKPRVAINAAGVAVVVFRDNAAGLWASVRTATTDWDAVETIRSAGVTDAADANPGVAIDAAGNVFAAFTYTAASGAATVRTSLRFASGGWQESDDLSSSVAAFQATYPTVAINASGTAILAWKQIGPGGFANIQARYGSTGTGIWGPIETVNDAGADKPVAAISGDGRAVVAWEREVAGANIGQARVREPGAAGLFGDIHNLSLAHANVTAPSIDTDGRGDFAVVSAPFDGSAQRALVSAYDASPPTVTTPSVTGTLLAGDPLVLGVNATDEWSTVGAPAWTFGDGGTGSGLTPVHIYAKAGTYTAHVAVTDSSGNSASQDVSVTVGASQATLSGAKFSGKWKVSRYTNGVLTVAGTAPRAGKYTIDILKGASRKLRLQTTLTAGPFTRKIKLLGPRFYPGGYTVVLTPDDAQTKGASTTASIAAPVSGVVDVAFLSGARSGTAARTLTGVKTIWASFHFIAKPKGALTLTWYKIGKKRVRIGATSKSSAARIVSFLRFGSAFSGTYQAVLSRKGVVIARASVKTKKG